MTNDTKNAPAGIIIRKSLIENTEGGVQFRLISPPIIGKPIPPATAPAKYVATVIFIVRIAFGLTSK